MSTYQAIQPGQCAMCSDQLIREEGSVGTGYAVLDNPKETKVCYSCCDKLQRLDLLKDNTFTGYLSSSGQFLTTWTGGKFGRVTHWGAVHPWSVRSYFGERHYIRVTDCHGQRWHGTGAEGQYCNLKKCK